MTKKSPEQKAFESSAYLDPKKWPAIKSKLKPRCSGHCCENVCIPISPEQLKASFLKRSAEDKARLSTSESWWNNAFIDIDLIYPMLRFKREQRVHEDSGDLNKSLAEKASGDGKYYVYSCVHYEKRTGNCGIYDIRPDMCKVHGLNGCGYKGCTYKPAVLLKKKHRKKQVKEAANTLES